MDLNWSKIQSIGTVASSSGKQFLEDLILSHGGKVNKDLFHFC
jgi:hypothetical protein